MSVSNRTDSRTRAQRRMTDAEIVVTIPTVPALLISRGHDRDRHVCCSSSACS